MLPDLKMPAKGAYFKVNGGSAESANVFWKSQTQQNTTLDSVGHVPLASLKVEAQQHSLLDFEHCLKFFRKALGMSEKESLVLFIDEIGELKKQADDVSKALMSAADARKGKLVFVFAHIGQQFLDHAAAGSGREVIALPLAALPVDTWKQKENWKKAAQNHAGIHQLLLQCCGHPRSLKRKAEPHVAPTEDALSVARQDIIRICKFNSETDDRMNKDIPRWFNFVTEDNLKPALRRDGLLLRLPHDKDSEFLPHLRTGLDEMHMIAV